jgi:predicted PurR-regulated permease PerM
VAWRLLVVAAALWVAILVLGRLRLVTVPVAFALFFTALLEPAATWLKERRIPPAAAAGLVLFSSLSAVVGVVALAGVRFVSQSRELGDAFVRGWDRLVAWIADAFPVSEEQIRAAVGSFRDSLGDDVGRLVFGGASTAAQVLGMAALTVLVTFFLLKDGDRMARWIAERTPADRRDELREVGAATWSRVSSFARGQALIAVVDAALTAVALVVIGVPAVLTLTLLTLLGGFVPLAGPVVAGAAAALVAFSAGGLADALWVVAAAVAIQQAEGNVLQPLVQGRAVRLHPLVVLLAVATGGVVGGLVGAFVAVPVAAGAVAVAGHLGRPALELDAGARRGAA